MSEPEQTISYDPHNTESLLAFWPNGHTTRYIHEGLFHALDYNLGLLCIVYYVARQDDCGQWVIDYARPATEVEQDYFYQLKRHSD